MSDINKSTKIIGFNMDIDLANTFRSKCASKGEKFQDVAARLFQQYIDSENSQEKAAS